MNFIRKMFSFVPAGAAATRWRQLCERRPFCHCKSPSVVLVAVLKIYSNMQRALSVPAMATRSFSSQATKLVKPPVALFGIEGRYTTALYSAASKNNKLDAVEKDLRAISSTIDKDSKFRDFLMNPLVNVTQKKQILKETLTSKLGVSDVTVNLINVMTENRRLKFLPAVAKSYIKVMETARGELECTVTTAKPLTEDAVKKDLEAALKGFTKNKLKIHMKVDPAIIGGMVIDFGGEHYVDMSIRSKVKMYTELIQQAV
ncbi:ATP synthase subunit O, mitochondrial [Halotydeus destructor]|nr:ATP synthase subunit O, mitochondrial [Halotydeus destructor]